MKKLLTLSLLFALGASAYAEEVKILSFSDGMPQPTDPPLMGLDMSPNGRYITGAIMMGAGILIADKETVKIVW